MYIVGNELTITWILAPTASPLPASSYDISFVPSNLDGTYTDASIINYTAPDASYPGSIEYKFTPNHIGRYQVFLTTGVASSYSIIDKKDFWVFAVSPSSIPTTEIPGYVSTAGIAPFKYAAQAYNNQWRLIDGVCQDPVNSKVIWFCGEKLLADTRASIANINTETGVITEYANVVTLPSGKLLDSIAVNKSGRVVVTNRSVETSNLYEAYYSDSPYTTWTKCTRSGFSTTFAGVKGLRYDPYLDVFWWITQINIGISADGITFNEQTIDSLGNNITEISFSSSSTILRLSDVGDNVLYGLSQFLGGSSERIFTTSIDPPIGTVPRAWEDLNGQTDIFGAGYPSQRIVGIAPNLAKTSAWAVTSESKLAIEATGGINFSFGTIIDLSSQIPGVPVRFFTIHDFGKYFIGTWASGTWAWYESTDMATWTLSTDTRITGYYWSAIDKTDFTKFVSYADNSGVAFIDQITTINYQIIAMI